MKERFLNRIGVSSKNDYQAKQNFKDLRDLQNPSRICFQHHKSIII